MSQELEIGSKKGKIPNRVGNDSHQKFTEPRGSKVTEMPKGERKQKRKHDEQDTASESPSDNDAKIVISPQLAKVDSPQPTMQDTLLATMQAGFGLHANIVQEEKARKSKKKKASTLRTAGRSRNVT